MLGKTITERKELKHMRDYKIEDSKHRNIYVDVTHDCNLKCNFCYDRPNRNKGSEISLEYFEDVCQRLTLSNPKRKWIRLLGGEATIDPRILDFIRIAKKYKHLVSIPTNGVRIGQDIEFCKELKKLAPFYVHISLDGGFDKGSFYKFINNDSQLGKVKKQALDNLQTVGFKHVHIGALIVRNLNEEIVPELVTIARKYDNIKGIHLRSGSNIGFYPAGNIPLKIEDLKVLSSQDIIEKSVIVDGITGPKGEKCCGGCYQYNGLIDGKRSVKVVLIEFGSERNSMACWWRGRLSPDNKILPFFQTMR